MSQVSESPFSALVWGRPVVPSTVGGISDLRNIDLNLIYIIKEQILPINGYVGKVTETLSPESQEVDPINGNVVTPYRSTYYDWVYYNPDPSNPALTGLLTVPTLSSSGSLAYFDYPNGVVYYSGVQSSNITITYNYYSVYVQDGFPDWGEEIKDLQSLRLPMISVDHVSRQNFPFSIGGSYEENRSFMIEVMANSDPQRDDITDILETSLRYDYPNTIDYKNGFPIDFRGDRNLAFDRGPASKWNHIRFKDASSRVIRTPGAPDKLRHRSIITLNVETN